VPGLQAQSTEFKPQSHKKKKKIKKAESELKQIQLIYLMRGHWSSHIEAFFNIRKPHIDIKISEKQSKLFHYQLYFFKEHTNKLLFSLIYF
jgi:hypothetical protein